MCLLCRCLTCLSDDTVTSLALDEGKKQTPLIVGWPCEEARGTSNLGEASIEFPWKSSTHIGALIGSLGTGPGNWQGELMWQVQPAVSWLRHSRTYGVNGANVAWARSRGIPQLDATVTGVGQHITALGPAAKSQGRTFRCERDLFGRPNGTWQESC